MSKIGAYGIYQNNLFDKAVQNKKTQEVRKAKDTPKVKEQVNLSNAAKELLEELKKTYGNMDFIIADYNSQEEAKEYLARGTKEYSVLLEPKVLEEMAADEAVKEEYVGKLDSAVNQLNQMVEQLGDKADEVTRMGVSISKDGNVSFFAELEKLSDKQRERIQQVKENKKAEAKEEKKAEEAAKQEEKLQLDRTKRTKLYADSTKELLEKIQNLDWDQIKAEEVQQTGSRLDLSI